MTAAPAWLAELAPTLSGTVLVVLAGLLLISAVVAAGLVLAARRGRVREARDVVRVVEDLRSGRTRERLDLDGRSPYAPVADAINRLAQDLGVRHAGNEAAREGFAALQEAARGYAVVNTDADGDLLGISAGAQQMFGWEEDAVLGRNASLLFDEGAWKDLLPKLARKSLRERGVETRSLMARRDGTRFHARVHVRALRSETVGPTGFLLVVQDITEQVRVENELRQAAGRTRVVLEGLPGGAGLVQQGRVVVANPALCALLEVDARDAVGFAFLERIATEDVLVVEDALAGLERGEAGATVETVVRLRGAGGRTAREARLTLARTEHEGAPAVAILLRDESVERRLQREVRAHAARLDALFEASEDAWVVLGEGTGGARVRFANRAFLDLFGFETAQVLGETEEELAGLLGRTGSAGAAAAAALANASDRPVEDVAPWDDSGERRVAIHAGPLATREAAPARFLHLRDVSASWRLVEESRSDTERAMKRQEGLETTYAKLQASYQDLDARRAEAEKLNQELRRLDAMKSDLLANVSHELQTPLVSIRGYTEMIHKGRLGPVNDEQKKGLGLALTNIDRLIAMIDNLLAFARMDREAAAIRPTAFSLPSVADETLQLLREKIEARSIKVVRRYEDPQLAVRADRDQIAQVFLNLLSNAVKFNRDGGTIEIVARRGKPGYAVVQVKDTGIGIAPADLEKIFERYFRAGEGTAEGSGIGLAIVRTILRAHGGAIHAASTAGEGSIFTFALPLAEEPRAKAPQPAPEPAPEPLPEPAEPPAVDKPKLRIIRRG